LVVEDPPGTFIATCTAELSHFSVYALVAPLDSDGDGILDLFDGIVDICPDSENVVDGYLPPLTGLVPEGAPQLLLPTNAFKSGRTVPLKLDYLCGSVPITDQDDVAAPELLGVSLVAGAESLDLTDLGSDEAHDYGPWFRYSGEHWIYNLDTGPYGPGTFEVRVKLPDGRTFKGGCVLR
jgi:hypothetical protein